MARWNDVSWVDDDDEVDDFLSPEVSEADEVIEEEDEADEFLAPSDTTISAPAPIEASEDIAPIDLDEVDGDDEQDWDPGKGFPSLTNAVRIWADGQGVLTKVRVSLGWRERVRNSSLEDAFTEALTLLTNFYRSTDAAEFPVFAEEIPATTQQLSWDSLLEVQAKLAELDQQIDELLDQPAAIWEGAEQAAVAADGHIRVTLDLHGAPALVEFDEQWLESTATASEISRGVMAAYHEARARFTPPKMLLTPRGQLQQEKRSALLQLFGQAQNGLAKPQL